MVDTPTTRRRYRKQALGTNTNTWGDTKLNEVLDALDQSGDGWLAYTAVDGINTLTSTNYTIADQSLNRGFKLTGGTLTTAFSVVVPSVQAWGMFWNASSYTATVKTASGTGVAIPTGKIGLVFCDGTNVLNIAPTFFPTALDVGSNKVTNMTHGTATGEAVEFDGMNAAIAAGGGTGSADGTVKMDALATAQFLNAAILVSGDITKTDNGNTMTIGVSVPALDEGKVVFLSQIFG
tara:strand:+ start:138 stop:845 length:708 start_codon:yes stop_codon:yes gene_type:complete